MLGAVIEGGVLGDSIVLEEANTVGAGPSPAGQGFQYGAHASDSRVIKIAIPTIVTRLTSTATEMQRQSQRVTPCRGLSSSSASSRDIARSDAEHCSIL
jgi:hypothetical protein